MTGFLGIVITGDMFNLYVFLEIASLAGYALIAVGEEGAPFASFNYLIFGTIGACFYLLGVGYLYINTGSLNMADLTKILPALYQSKVVLVAFAFFLVGVSLKMALFPLHVWLPDAYTYAPSPVSALLAPLMTKVGAYVMIRIMFTVFEPRFSIELIPATTILGWMAAGAILFGALMALAQSDLKRMLAYILVSEVGYIALGVDPSRTGSPTGRGACQPERAHRSNPAYPQRFLHDACPLSDRRRHHVSIRQQGDSRAPIHTQEDALYHGSARDRRSIGDRHTADLWVFQQVVSRARCD